MTRLRLKVRLMVLGGVVLLLLVPGVSFRFSVLLGMGLVYLSLCFYLITMRGLHELQRVVDEVCVGNLTTIPHMAGNDEVAFITQGVERMTHRLSQLVSTVRSEAQLVAMESDTLSGNAVSMSDRTERQASSLEQTSASVCELADMVKRNASDMQDATLLAEQLRGAATGAARIVDTAVVSMQDMEKRSTRMNEIIDTINGIAFQTNILALNAAVESARAGEAGRGFAVVASEVRTLAHRSATAASEIKKLIDGSALEVGLGVTRIQQARTTMTTVVDGIIQVTEKLDGVAKSSALQSNGLQEIAAAVVDLDQITQRNALMAESSVRAAESLRSQAQKLSAGVTSMRLRQGCADEARALVEQAVHVIHQVGKQAAKARFHDRNGGFNDRDMFIVVVDRNGYFRAFGMDPTKADKPAVAAPGVDIAELNRKTWHIADAGGGWVQFQSRHPVTAAVIDKMAYVLPADKDWVVLCSINKTDGTDTSGMLHSEVASQNRRKLSNHVNR